MGHTMPEMSGGGGPDRDPRVAVISLHTSPQDQPGTGDSGGMNVYILSVARRLAAQGIHVDVFTRRRDGDGPRVEEVAPGTRVINVPAGPSAHVAKEALPPVLPSFLDGVVQFAAAEDPRPHGHSPYDVVHSHYWLSGWVGGRAKRIWGAPHVASFHTLGKVKNLAVEEGDSEPAIRLRGEEAVVRRADRILSPTVTEASQLVRLYGADRRRIDVVPPGVDASIFLPRPRAEARKRLGLGDERLALFVGRLQAFKGPDVAIRTVSEAIRRDPPTMRQVVLVVIGGDGGGGELPRLALELGMADRVRFLPSMPHPELALYYSASEVVLMPSRSESFGLVALEAQACGTPVIATATGGLNRAVRHGRGGFLVPEPDPVGFADRLLMLLRDPVLAGRFSAEAVRHAASFSWDATVAEIRRVYEEVTASRGDQGIWRSL